MKRSDKSLVAKIDGSYDLIERFIQRIDQIEGFEVVRASNPMKNDTKAGYHAFITLMEVSS